jgi:hypothetical protein
MMLLRRSGKKVVRLLGLSGEGLIEFGIGIVAGKPIETGKQTEHEYFGVLSALLMLYSLTCITCWDVDGDRLAV